MRQSYLSWLIWKCCKSQCNVLKDICKKRDKEERLIRRNTLGLKRLCLILLLDMTCLQD